MIVYVNGTKLVESSATGLTIEQVRQVLVREGVVSVENAVGSISDDGSTIYFNKKANTLG